MGGEVSTLGKRGIGTSHFPSTFLGDVLRGPKRGFSEIGKVMRRYFAPFSRFEKIGGGGGGRGGAGHWFCVFLTTGEKKRFGGRGNGFWGRAGGANSWGGRRKLAPGLGPWAGTLTGNPKPGDGGRGPVGDQFWDKNGGAKAPGAGGQRGCFSHSAGRFLRIQRGARLGFSGRHVG